MSPEERVSQALEQALPEIINNLKKELVSSVDYQIKQNLANSIVKTVHEFVQDEIVPEMREVLIGNKVGILSSIPKIAEEMTTALSKAMEDQLKEKLSSSYNRGSVLKALFE